MVSVGKDRVFLSLRESRLDKADHASPVDAEYSSIEQLSSGPTIRGYVKAVSNVGVFVRLVTHCCV